MRLNLPVTGREFVVSSQSNLVSTTDTQGRITYCNPAFIEVSGYSRDELLGQPHNLIRHPDMPAEAFRDLWDTIASGQPWTGLVVNRRKNGDHYWVQANVTPLVEGGQVVGYMSVRTTPSRDAVEAATALYATMRAEAERGELVHRLKEGEVRRHTPAARVAQALRLDLGGQLALAALGCAGGGYLAGGQGGWLGWLGLAASAAAGTWLLRERVLRPLRQVLASANTLAAGDLTQRPMSQRRDLMGRLTAAMSQLNVNLASVVGDARRETEAMNASLREIAAGNHDLSARTEAQAANLEQTAASMEQITGTVRNSTEHADRAAKLAQEACTVTEAGNQTMNDLATTMEAIREASGRIGEINGVIDGIAFQTSILALNAAVEAARAGDHGRGFAVVASEVRALATRTSEAAREVRALIDGSSSHVHAGAELTAAARQSLEASVASTRRVGALISEISQASHEQLQGISQVNEAVAHLDTITQQNAALVEEVAASTQSLKGQAEVLVDAVRVFRLDGPGENRGTPAVDLRRQARERMHQVPLSATPQAA